MSGFTPIREGLAANLAPLKERGWQVSPWMLANAMPPAIHVVGPSAIDYDRAMHRGADEISVDVQAFVGLTLDRGAQETLDELLAATGDLSIKTLLESDRTLGGVCTDMIVQSAGGYRIYGLGSVQGDVLGSEWTVFLELNPNA